LAQLIKQFERYQSKAEERDHQRRRENVHVLIAIGILGAYASFASSNTSILNIGQSQLMTKGLVFLSGIYLLGKLFTITMKPMEDVNSYEKLDEWVLPLFLLISVYGLLAIGLGRIAFRSIQITLPSIPFPENSGVMVQFITVFTLTVLMIAYMSQIRFKRIIQREKALQELLDGTLTSLYFGGAIDQSKKNELEKRFASLFTDEKDIPRLEKYLTLVGLPNKMALTDGDRDRLEKLLNRTGIRFTQGTIEQGDIEKLEEFLSEIEER
jgi:uncharacterized membrane protein YidH (DUF202 family)